MNNFNSTEGVGRLGHTLSCKETLDIATAEVSNAIGVSSFTPAEPAQIMTATPA